MKISIATLEKLNSILKETPEIERRVFKAPDLPPGVVPKGARFALDSGNASQVFGWLNGQSGWCGLGFPGYAYLSELAQRSEYIAPTTTIANEMTRKWIKFTGTSEEQTEELEDAFEQFAVQEHFRTCAVNDGYFGRGQLFIRLKGQTTDIKRQLPLMYDPETIEQGQLLGFKPIEPIWTTPTAYNSIDPTRDDFYRPDFWYVMGRKTHASRLLSFISCPVPDMLKPAYNFGGMSLSQRIEPYVVRWLKTVDSVNRLISNFSTSVIMTDMQSTLEDQGDDNLLKRLSLFTQFRDNRALMVLNKDTEEMAQINTPLSGLSELQAQSQEHMAAPTHIPLVKLTGITPDGLNASSEGEIKVFYDFIASEQQNLYKAPLTIVLRIIQCHLWGKIDENIGFEWVPLDSPTDKEVAEMRKSDAEMDATLLDHGVVSPDEVRERVRNNPNSGYTFLNGSAPPPPEPGEPGGGSEHEASLAEKAAERPAGGGAE